VALQPKDNCINNQIDILSNWLNNMQSHGDIKWWHVEFMCHKYDATFHDILTIALTSSKIGDGIDWLIKWQSHDTKCCWLN
jgi:hypothetical protein